MLLNSDVHSYRACNPIEHTWLRIILKSGNRLLHQMFQTTKNEMALKTIIAERICSWKDERKIFLNNNMSVTLLDIFLILTHCYWQLCIY